MQDLIEDLRACAVALMATGQDREDPETIAAEISDIINRMERHQDNIIATVYANGDQYVGESDDYRVTCGSLPETLRLLASSLEPKQSPESAGSAKRLGEARLADVEQRLNSLTAAMREVARKDCVHPSVRFLADTIAINLSASAPGHTDLMVAPESIGDLPDTSPRPHDMQAAAGVDDNLIYLTVCTEPLRAVQNHRRIYAVRFSKLPVLEVTEAQIKEDRPNG